MNKLLIICGPTATGKTDLGILVAKRFNGEIVSADSRQVYRGMDIGTGKDLPVNSQLITLRLRSVQAHNSQLGIANPRFTVGYRKKSEIPIWLVDICDPNYVFNVGEYKQLAELVIQDMWSRNKLPIVVGGTGLYIRSIIEPLDLVHIPPNISLRQKLDTYSISELQVELRQLSPNRFQQMNESDRLNPRRLVRAIETEMWKGKSVSRQSSVVNRQNVFDVLFIGLTASFPELSHRIDQRVKARVKEGIVEEIEVLLTHGYTWDLPSMSSLGYREWKTYFEPSVISHQPSDNKEMIQTIVAQWKLHEWQYAKRQMTYFKKMKQIVWYDVTQPVFKSKVFDTIGKWYNTLNSKFQAPNSKQIQNLNNQYSK